MKIKIRQDVKIGLICCLAIGVLVWGINFLKGQDIFSSQKTYYAIFSDLGGLAPSGGVFISGLKVGQVKKIENTDPIARQFLVVFQVKSDIKLPINSEARVYSTDLLGSKGLELILGNALVYHDNKDTVFTGENQDLMAIVAGEIKPLKEKTEQILMNIDTVLNSLKVVLNPHNQENLSASIAHINTITSNLSSASVDLNKLVGKEKARVSTIMANAENISRNLSNLSDTLSNANIAKTLSDANTALASLSEIVTKIKKGDGNIGMLVNNDSLYYNLENTSRNLNLLIEDVKQNPKRYVKFSLF